MDQSALPFNAEQNIPGNFLIKERNPTHNPQYLAQLR